MTKTPLPLLLLVSSAFLVGASSCQKSVDPKDMARDLCDCMRPMADAYLEMEAMETQPTTMQALEDLMDRLEKQSEKTDACIDRLEETYGEALDTQQSDIEPVMREICPEVMDILSRTDLG